MLIPLLVGAALAGAIALAAARLGSLSTSGALAAFLVGTVTFGIGGLEAAVLLILFFVSSSALSRMGRARKGAVVAAFAKGSRRDMGQVLANGGLATALSVAYGLTGHEAWLAGAAGALAAVTADTWATELGVLARRAPRLITTGLRVDPGTSGAISAEGTLASALGAALIATAAALLMGEPGWVLPITLSGVAGALLDSLLGGTVQAIYWCPACGKETERHPLHMCGASTHAHRGWRWLGNDAVNLAASIGGAGLALILLH